MNGKSDALTPTGPCDFGCGRESPLRETSQPWIDGTRIEVRHYRCRWHEAALTRWANRMRDAGTGELTDHDRR